MNEPLSAEDVSITTASIEVKIIRIGKRQMTQAVFRQLQREAWDGESPVWGWVNFCTCPNGMTYTGYNHRHFIWQCGNELRRSIALSILIRATPADEDRWYADSWRIYLDEIGQLFIAV